MFDHIFEKKKKKSPDSPDRTQSRRNVFRRSEKNSSYATDTRLAEYTFSILVPTCARVNLQKSYRRECESEQTFALRNRGNIMRCIRKSFGIRQICSVKSCNNTVPRSSGRKKKRKRIPMGKRKKEENLKFKKLLTRSGIKSVNGDRG